MTPEYMERTFKHNVDIEIPAGWTDIPESSFAGMPLLSTCTIASNVKTIHEGAFKDLNKTVQIEEAGELKDYCPLVNGLQQLIFNSSADVSCFGSTMRKTFSETCSIDEVSDKCYNDDVKSLVASHISPSV